MRDLYTIRERKEGIGSHHGTLQAKAEGRSFFDCLLQGINARSLSNTTGQQLTVYRQDDGIRFGVLANFTGEEQGVNLVCGRSNFRDHLQVGFGVSLQVKVLFDYTIEDTLELLGFLQLLFLQEYHPVLLAF